MKLSPSSSFVKQALASHAWIGLMAGALMYLVCLSGTLAVFYKAFERWEQPAVAEYREVKPAAVQSAFETVLTSGTEITEHLFVSLPTADMPRLAVATENEGWFVDRDGSLGEKVAHDWTHMLTDLHLFLHLPESFGMVVVSILGAVLCGLIVSGFLAHPRLFRDAFTLRLRGSRHLEQADIHNRLSVWGAPFHLMIAVTGAYFGLAAVIVLVLATAFHGGDRDAAMASVFGEEPALHQPDAVPAIDRALEDMTAREPDLSPFFVTVHEAGTPGQYMELAARHPGRLSWAEWYRYDADGQYLGRGGFTDGTAGRQVVYSMYRLHFGDFGGFWTQVGYAILGLALTVVSVTGINIWLVRRKGRDSLNNLWAGLVWGTPPALVLAALGQVMLGLSAIALFWGGIAAAMALAIRLDSDSRSRRWMQRGTALLLAALVIAYSFVFGSAALAPIALAVNTGLLLVAGVFLWLGGRGPSGAEAPEAAEAAG